MYYKARVKADHSITDEDVIRYHFVARQNSNRRIGDFRRKLDLVEGYNIGNPDSQWYFELYIKV